MGRRGTSGPGGVSRRREQLGWKSAIAYEDGIPAAVTDYLARNGELTDPAAKQREDSKVAVAGGA